ncbi:MAG: succinate dehydrogenase, cytochrome b556 subunit [Steroidobacteraceae bacterium]
MAQHERPLSPFMHYRWQYTNTLSILHRLSGVFMSVGIALLVYWLVAAASGRDSYDAALNCFASPLTKAALFAWVLAFFYHLLNGVRHLGWDLGYGFEKAVARKTGTLVFIGAIVLTLLTWWCITLRITASMSGVVL